MSRAIHKMGRGGGISFVYTSIEIDNTNSATFPAMAVSGSKQLVCIACYDNDILDVTGLSMSVTVDGQAATQIALNSYGSGTNTSIAWLGYVDSGVTPPTADVVATLSGFSGNVDNWVCTLVSINGIAAGGPLAYAVHEDDLDTTGAVFVVGAFSDLSGTIGNMTGGGNPTTMTSVTELACGYDDAPPGGLVGYSCAGSPSCYVVAAF